MIPTPKCSTSFAQIQLEGQLSPCRYRACSTVYRTAELQTLPLTSPSVRLPFPTSLESYLLVQCTGH
jgi:hypothetical protein